jgi:DNA polymerase-3 subunit delta
MASLRPEQLPAHLGKTLAPAYLLHGDEPLLALESADAIRAAARGKGYSERKVLTVDRYFKWAELAAAGSSMSLFGDRTLIELRIPSGKPGSEGSEAISRFCAQLPSDVLLMTSLPRLGKREQSSAWFSALAGVGSTVEIYPVERAALPRWMAERLARQNQKANAETLAFLTDCVEGNLLAAHQEIRKLGLLLPEGELPFEAVREAVLNVARFDAGKLSEAMLGGDRARLARMLDGLRAEGEATPRIVWLMAEEIRAVARVQEGLASGRSVSDLCREHRIWGEPRQTLVGRAAQRLKSAALLQALRHAARVDRIAKGVGRGDAWDDLLQLGLRLSA